MGPWNDFEVVDGASPGDVVGIRRINDGPWSKVFTMDDLQALPNHLLENPQNSTIAHHNLDRIKAKQLMVEQESGTMR